MAACAIAKPGLFASVCCTCQESIALPSRAFSKTPRMMSLVRATMSTARSRSAVMPVETLAITGSVMMIGSGSSIGASPRAVSIVTKAMSASRKAAMSLSDRSRKRRRQNGWLSHEPSMPWTNMPGRSKESGTRRCMLA